MDNIDVWPLSVENEAHVWKIVEIDPADCQKDGFDWYVSRRFC